MASKSDFPIGAILLMAAGTLALLVIIGTSIWLANTSTVLTQDVMRARQTRTMASEVLETLLNAETSQRGYLLSDSPRYLEPYNVAAQTITRDLAALKALEQGNEAARPLLAQLTKVVDAKMTELRQTIALAQAGKRDEALAVVRTDRGINSMDDARGVLRPIITNAEQLVNVDMAQLGANSRLLRLVTVVGGVVVVLFGVAAMWIVFGAIRQAVEAREQVQELNVSLEDRVLRRTAALTRANEEIQRFAYIVSHDLRAPLVNIMGFTSELEVGTKSLKSFFADEDEQARPAAREAALDIVPEAVKFIRSSTGKMDRLINAILKLSREGRRELTPEKTDFNKVFALLTASLQHQIDETQTTVTLSENLPTIVSDRLALEQVFGNLLDNALKYLQPGRPGQLLVAAENARGAVIITIKDNGRGIAQNDLERIFELFRRAGRQDRPGEGIGLAHVRALVRRLGGDITVMSELGVGSQFRVLLPHSLPSDTGGTAS